jgi:hypothetical protein
MGASSECFSIVRTELGVLLLAPPRSSSLLPPPSTGCMTDSNLSGTSSASCAVALLLLLAVARVAAMPLWASIPTDLFVVFLYILHLP